MSCVAWKWTPSLLALALFWTPDGLTAAGTNAMPTTTKTGTNAMPTTTNRLIYKQSFDDGPATWQVGRKKAEPPNWHKNFLGEHGGGYPLAWEKTGGRSGGYVSSSSPWWLDDNHPHFMWLQMIAFAYSEQEKIAGQDLRNATFRVSVRGRNVAPQGARLFFWIQGPAGGVMRNWALTYRPIETELLDGAWHDLSLPLPNDESRWTFMGDGHSLQGGSNTLDQVLGASHIDWGFLLCGVQVTNLPTGRIDFDQIEILRKD
jgi:hypothetical protein